jgi:hypothetical protein
MARAHGVSPATVARIWDAHGLAPHRIRTFKLSRDPRFIEKLTDIVGLYLNAPDKAIVLCVGEKSQIQVLDRTQPSLPLKRGRAGTMTHDYKRNGTTTLFAALDLLDGTVIGECHTQPRPGVPRLPAPARPDLLKGARAASHRRQLRDAHPSGRADAARRSCPRPLQAPFHADELVLAEPRRALVPRADHQAPPAGRLAQRARPRCRDLRLHRAQQHGPQGIRLDGLRRGDPPPRSAVVEPFLRRRTSGSAAARSRGAALPPLPRADRARDAHHAAPARRRAGAVYLRCSP